MQVTGTKEAFTAMLLERGVYKRLGVDTSTVSNWKKYLEQGNSISLDKMEEMLIKAGATVAQEKVWKMPTESDFIYTDEADFIQAVKFIRPGKNISVNLEEVDENKIFAAIRDRASKIKCEINEDESSPSVMTYKFTK